MQNEQNQHMKQFRENTDKLTQFLSRFHDAMKQLPIKNHIWEIFENFNKNFIQNYIFICQLQQLCKYRIKHNIQIERFQKIFSVQKTQDLAGHYKYILQQLKYLQSSLQWKQIDNEKDIDQIKEVNEDSILSQIDDLQTNGLKNIEKKYISVKQWIDDIVEENWEIERIICDNLQQFIWDEQNHGIFVEYHNWHIDILKSKNKFKIEYFQYLKDKKKRQIENDIQMMNIIYTGSGCVGSIGPFQLFDVNEYNKCIQEMQKSFYKDRRYQDFLRYIQFYIDNDKIKKVAASKMMYLPCQKLKESMKTDYLNLSISDSDDNEDNEDDSWKPVKYIPDKKYVSVIDKKYYFVSDDESEDEQKKELIKNRTLNRLIYNNLQGEQECKKI